MLQIANAARVHMETGADVVTIVATVVTTAVIAVMIDVTTVEMIVPANCGALAVVDLQEGHAAVDVADGVQRLGLMSRARFATKKVMLPKTVGGASKTMTMITLTTRKLMLHHTGWIPTGTPIRVHRITSLESSIT
jgi:threonine dehydratase